MSVYSTNQARHLYVVHEASDYSVGKDQEGCIFIKVKNADGEFLRSDLITNIIRAKATSAEKMKRELNAVEVSGTPSKAGVYTLGINYRQWIADSDESFYQEWASAKLEMAAAAPTATEISNFYKRLAVNLAKNTEKQGMVQVYLIDSASSKTAVTSGNEVTLTGTYSKIAIVEIEQKWVLGTTPQTVVYIDKSNVIAPWATITDVHSEVFVENGKEIADLEYFCLGERGDQYRNIGWPYTTPTRGKADSANTYDVIDIHYAYIGSNEGPQKSEKTLTIACKADGSFTIVNALIGAINTATGETTIEKLS